MMELSGAADGRITVLAEQSLAAVIQDSFCETFGSETDRFLWLPAVERSLELQSSDCILLALAAHPQTAAMCGQFGIARHEGLGADAYAIEASDTGRPRCLAVIGGNPFGLVAGAWDVVKRLELTRDGALYQGGRSVERPAFSQRLFWSWDHSAAWADSPGQIDWGCNNDYCKPSEAFVVDYRRQINYAPQARANGIIIAGFLRDDHGGVAAAQELVGYSRSRLVRVMPCFCSGGYNGVYYQGAHPFNEQHYLAAHPDQAAVGYDGKPLGRLCQSHPAATQWRRAATGWLISTFELGGAEMEFSDYSACQCPRCREQRSQMAGVDADYLKELRVSYGPCLDRLLAEQPDGLFLYAVFTGFNLDLKMKPAPEPPVRVRGAQPDFISHLPPQAVCLWTITEMLHDPQVPLACWLDDGNSKAFYEGEQWPRGLRAPAARNMGLLHQGSYWWSRNGCHTRYGVEIASIKEACLKGAEAGLEGLVLIAETSDRCVPCELNYEAFAHFTYHPQDSLRQFASKRLAPLVGGEDAAQLFVEIMTETEHGPAAPGRYRQVEEEGIRWREQVSGRQLHRGEPGARPPLPQPLPPGVRRLRAVRTWRRWEWLRLRALRGPAPSDTDYLPFP